MMECQDDPPQTVSVGIQSSKSPKMVLRHTALLGYSEEQACLVALCRVENTLNMKRVLKGVKKLCDHHQKRPLLEVFQSLILRFSPKNVVFPFMGMLCRLHLAVIH